MKRTRFPFFLFGASLLLVSAQNIFAANEPEPIPLWPEGIPGLIAGLPAEETNKGSISHVNTPTLTPFVLPAGEGPRTAMIVCPGGGYSHLAFEKEGLAIARWLNTLGISAFVLKYRLNDYGQPAPLQDGLRAMRIVRSRANEWHLDPKRIGVIGFSAGGHLAASLGTMFDAPESRLSSALDKTDGRPDFLMLVYPVITLKEGLTHKGSRLSLLGANPSPELVEQFSMETRVTEKTPPTFIVHSSADPAVPVQNSVEFYLALKKAGVPVEMHLYEKGPHGFGLNPGYGPTSDWPKRAEEWLAARKLIAPEESAKPSS